MGRKPKSYKAEEKANPANENANPPVESMKDEQRSFSSMPLKKKSLKKALRKMNAVVRRSGRLRNVRPPMSKQEMLVEEINLADSDKEEDPLVGQSNSEPHIEQLNPEPPGQQFNSVPLSQQLNSDPISYLRSFENKIDFLVQSVKEFQSQGTNRPFESDNHSAEINYRSLYIDSQKKIDALTEENHQLAKRLEFANGKAEAFEQMKDVFGNFKDMVVMTNMTRATEAMINLSSQAAIGKLSLPEPCTTRDAAPLAVSEHNKTSSPTHKKYARKKR